MSKLTVLLFLVVFVVAISAEPNRPRPQQVPPRPPHPRLRREANPGTHSPNPRPPHPRNRRNAEDGLTRPVINIPLKPVREEVQNLLPPMRKQRPLDTRVV